MEENLYLIGEFAAMNKVSPRMLRHYDKINLLKPASINEKGYRYYSEPQIATIAQIIELRDCDFSLDEIAQILEKNCDAFFASQVEHKLVDLNRQARLKQKSIRLLSEFHHRNRQDDFMKQYGISLTQREESLLLVFKQFVEWEQTETEFDKLYAFLDTKHLDADGCAVLLSHFDEREESKIQIGVPVAAPLEKGEYKTIILPATRCISTLHYGDYYQIGYAYNALMNHATQNGYLLGSCFVERYFIDRSHTANANQYVTEVSVSIQNNP